VIVWDVSSQQIVARLKGHRHGVQCVAFSPSQPLLVSVGFNHDGSLFVWNWKTEQKIATGRVSQKVRTLCLVHLLPRSVFHSFLTADLQINGISFFEDGTYFVTCGKSHVKFWSVEGLKVSLFSSLHFLENRSHPYFLEAGNLPGD